MGLEECKHTVQEQSNNNIRELRDHCLVDPADKISACTATSEDNSLGIKAGVFYSLHDLISRVSVSTRL